MRHFPTHPKGTYQMCHAGHSGYGYPRERESISYNISLVSTKYSVFSLTHACLAAGLFHDLVANTPVNYHILGELAEKKWEKFIDNFLADFSKVTGMTPLDLSNTVPDIGCVEIGWQDDHSCTEPFGLCPDLPLTLSVLSRCTGDIYFRNRPPDLHWESLFSRQFAIDDPDIEYPGLSQDPWSKFDWKVTR